MRILLFVAVLVLLICAGIVVVVALVNRGRKG
jgi:hypothetical protein